MQDPKITVIVPVYNEEKALAECLDSLKNQSFSQWECICVDDGSRDRSWEILQGFHQEDSRFLIVRKENGGVTSARRLGVSMASGEFILFMDADDVMPREALATLWKHQNATGAQIVRGNFSYWENGQLREAAVPEGIPCSHGRHYKTRRGSDFLPYCLRVCSLWMSLYARELFAAQEHFPDKKVILGEDGLTLFSLLLAAERAVYVPDIVYWYRSDSSSSVSLKLYADREKERKADIDFTEELLKLIQKRKGRIWPLKYYAVDCIYGKFRGTSYFHDNRIALRKIYWRFFCCNPFVQLYVLRMNWKKWIKMWLAFRSFF